MAAAPTGNDGITPTAAAAAVAQDEAVFREIDAYPWHDDAEFQAGLSALLAPNADPQQVERLTMRAKCFYYSRKHGNVPVDFPSYVNWHLSRHQAQASPTATNSTGADGAPSTTHPTVSQMRPTAASLRQVMGETAAAPGEENEATSASLGGNDNDNAMESSEAAAATPAQPPPYPMTFNQIVELISTGAPIPGIRDIPDTLLEGQSTASTQQRRRKPWEKDAGDGANATATAAPASAT